MALPFRGGPLTDDQPNHTDKPLILTDQAL